MSTHGIGIDGMLYYYSNLKDVYDREMTDAFIQQSNWDANFPRPYAVAASEKLLNLFSSGHLSGITATAPGFYGPQGRKLRLETTHPDLNEAISGFRYNGQRIVNFEMETSALYGLGKMLGHETLTICAIIANRVIKKYSSDYKITVKKLIEQVLEKLSG
jgi:uridine phosphorylase